MTIAEIAAHLSGAMHHCDETTRILGLAAPDHAGNDHAAVIFDSLPSSLGDAALLIVGPKAQPLPNRPLLIVEEPRIAFAQLTALFAVPMATGAGIHSTAIVAHDADIDSSAHVGPHCVVESGAVIGANVTLVAQVYVGANVIIGDNSTIMPAATLYPGTRLGQRVIVQAGARLGCDGFGFVTESPTHPKVHSLAGLRIGDDVEIGANTTIQRGTLIDSVIGRGTKIGDGCNIGHNVECGEYGLLVGNIAVAGTVLIGDRVHIAAGVLVRDHVTIGDGAVLMMGCHVTADVPPRARMLGAPALPEDEQKARNRVLRTLVERDAHSNP